MHWTIKYVVQYPCSALPLAQKCRVLPVLALLPRDSVGVQSVGNGLRRSAGGVLPINSTDYFCLLGNDLVQATNYLAALVKGSNCAITVAPAAHDLPPENFAFLIAMCLTRGCFQAKEIGRASCRERVCQYV